MPARYYDDRRNVKVSGKQRVQGGGRLSPVVSPPTDIELLDGQFAPRTNVETQGQVPRDPPYKL